MCSDIDTKEDSRDSALYSGVDSRSESDFTSSAVDNASEYSKLNVPKLQVCAIPVATCYTYYKKIIIHVRRFNPKYHF